MDILKSIRNLKLIDFKDLCILLKSNSNTISNLISRETVDKAIQLHNYFLLNKIYLTRYDLESLNELKREKSLLRSKSKTKDPIRLKKVSSRRAIVAQEDKSTEMTLDKIVVNKKEESNQTEEQEATRITTPAKATTPLTNRSDLKLNKSDTFHTIKTYDTFLATPPPNLLTDRTFLDRNINVLETPPSLLELLYLEQIRKKNMATKF